MFFRAFSSVARQMPGWCPQRRGTARTLPNFFVALCIFCVVLCIFIVLFYVMFVLWRSLYCLCVYVYWTTATGWQTHLLLNVSYHIKNAIFLPWRNGPPVGQGVLIVEDSWSHSDTTHSVGLLWTSNQTDAGTSTWQHTTLTTDTHPCSRWDSNPRSQ
jgi:hypothetical protein